MGCFPDLAKEKRRENAGMAIALGALCATIWPIGAPLVWCLTGFAEYGVLKTKTKKCRP